MSGGTPSAPAAPVASSPLAPPGPRLLAAARERARRDGATTIDPASVLVVGEAASPQGDVTPVACSNAHSRILVLSWIGAHRDAREPLLVRLWELEEAARATGLPTIVLRLGPLVGPRAPLLAMLAGRPRWDRRLERSLVQPVLEDDVVSGLARLLAGQLEWSSWYEVCGEAVWTVGELAAAAAAGTLGTTEATAAWEPAPAVLAAQGVAEWRPWALASGVTPRPIGRSAAAV